MSDASERVPYAKTLRHRVRTLETENLRLQKEIAGLLTAYNNADADAMKHRKEVARLRGLLIRVLVAEGRCPLKLMTDIRSEIDKELVT